ncbi:MAG: hypothetical protein AAF446_03245 [Pseudomonadota bacterium]
MLAAAVLLRSMAAPGYMPSALVDGYPVMLCPQGLDADWYQLISAAKTVDAHAHHHHGHSHHHHFSNEEAPSSPSIEADHPLDRCALGSALAMLALPSSTHSVEAVSSTGSNPIRISEAPSFTCARVFRARAPPRLIPV